MDERTFPRRFASLAEIFRFTAEFFGREAIGQQHRFAMDFAIEELFTNMVKYNPGNPDGIRIALERREGEVQVRLTDSSAEPFDVTAAPEADTRGTVEERPIGKLGLHLVKKLVDDIGYRHENGASTVTFIKKLE